MTPDNCGSNRFRLVTYDVHGDGSGVAYASRLRPATNVRPTGRLWNFAADLFVIDWLERSGLGYDVVTRLAGQTVDGRALSDLARARLSPR